MEKGTTPITVAIGAAGLLLFAAIELVQLLLLERVNHAFSVVLLLLSASVGLVALRLRPGLRDHPRGRGTIPREDMYDTLADFSKSLAVILDRQALADEIVHTLINVIGLKSASLYVLDAEQPRFVLASSYGLPAGAASTVPALDGDPALGVLCRERTPMLCEMLTPPDGDPATHALQKAFAAAQAELCLPFVNHGRLLGFCNLGPRAGAGTFGRDTLDLLATLGRSAAAALDNAMLWEEQRRSRTLMRRSDRMRSLAVMAAGFAHEVRNPLTSIKTFVQLVPARKDDQEFMTRFGVIVAEDVARIERLINEILDYARDMEPKFKDEDLNEVVSSSLYFVELRGNEGKIRTATELAPDLPPVMMDRQQMKQVLLNFYLNAVDAMAPDGGVLAVRTRGLLDPSGDQRVQIEIEDTGCGIAPGALEHIFDPFYTTKHESHEREGTGLGLAISHQIVHEHQGHIHVSSEVGRGTTFVINIPVKQPARRNPTGEDRRKRRVESDASAAQERRR